MTLRPVKTPGSNCVSGQSSINFLASEIGSFPEPLRSTRASFRIVFLLSLAFLSSNLKAQQTASEMPPPPPHAKQIHLKHVLVIGQTKGFEHDSVSPAMAAIFNMGKESGLWDTMMRTDTELLTKKDLQRNTKNLNYFDAVIFASTTGELDMDDSQKQDLMSFIKEDGKGFVGIHAALDTNYKWPEYGEIIGGWFDQHPWMTFNAPIINEDPTSPPCAIFPRPSSNMTKSISRRIGLAAR